ncbi:MAG: sulfatase [Actinomycetota bacterium]
MDANTRCNGRIYTSNAQRRIRVRTTRRGTRTRGRIAARALRCSATLALALAAIAVEVSAPAVAQVPAVPPAKERPNVLLIVTDDQRADAMGVMPSVRRWFGEEGTSFPNAYVTTPLCCPSRASIMTGRYAHNHEVLHNGTEAVEGLSPRSTLAYHLDQAGYHTAIFGKYFNKWPHTSDPGSFDEWAITNFNYTNSTFNVNGTPRVVSQYSTDFISDRAARFVDERQASDDPWFLYLAPMAAHAPFEPAPRHEGDPVPRWSGNAAVEERDRSDKPRWLRSFDVGARQGRRLRSQQLRTLMSVDEMVDRLMRKLETSGEDRDTIAVFTSDNGHFWGEHGLDDKRAPYIQSVKVPLLLRWPDRVASGAVDERLAANIDIAPTLLQAANLTPEHTVDGRSLLEPWDRNHLFLEYFLDEAPFDIVPTWRSILTRDRQYVEYYGKRGSITFTEYYDLDSDPWQLENLLGDGIGSNDPSSPEINELKRLLVGGRACSGTSCP